MTGVEPMRPAQHIEPAPTQREGGRVSVAECQGETSSNHAPNPEVYRDE